MSEEAEATNAGTATEPTAGAVNEDEAAERDGGDADVDAEGKGEDGEEQKKQESDGEVPEEGAEAGARKKRGAVTDANQIKKITAETNEVLMKLQTKKGVLGVLVANNSGAPVRDTFPQTKRQFVYNLAGYMHQFRHKCNYVLKILYGEKHANVHVFRIRSVKYEILCIPDPDYYLVVVQDPSLITTSV